MSGGFGQNIRLDLVKPNKPTLWCPFLGVLPPVFTGEMLLEGREQKCSESTTRSIRPL